MLTTSEYTAKASENIARFGSKYLDEDTSILSEKAQDSLRKVKNNLQGWDGEGSRLHSWNKRFTAAKKSIKEFYDNSTDKETATKIIDELTGAVFDRDSNNRKKQETNNTFKKQVNNLKNHIANSQKTLSTEEFDFITQKDANSIRMQQFALQSQRNYNQTEIHNIDSTLRDVTFHMHPGARNSIAKTHTSYEPLARRRKLVGPEAKDAEIDISTFMSQESQKLQEETKTKIPHVIDSITRFIPTSKEEEEWKNRKMIWISRLNQFVKTGKDPYTTADTESIDSRKFGSFRAPRNEAARATYHGPKPPKNVIPFEENEDIPKIIYPERKKSKKGRLGKWALKTAAAIALTALGAVTTKTAITEYNKGNAYAFEVRIKDEETKKRQLAEKRKLFDEALEAYETGSGDTHAAYLRYRKKLDPNYNPDNQRENIESTLENIAVPVDTIHLIQKPAYVKKERIPGEEKFVSPDKLSEEQRENLKIGLAAGLIPEITPNGNYVTNEEELILFLSPTDISSDKKSTFEQPFGPSEEKETIEEITLPILTEKEMPKPKTVQYEGTSVPLERILITDTNREKVDQIAYQLRIALNEYVTKASRGASSSVFPEEFVRKKIQGSYGFGPDISFANKMLNLSTNFMLFDCPSTLEFIANGTLPEDIDRNTYHRLQNEIRTSVADIAREYATSTLSEKTIVKKLLPRGESTVREIALAVSFRGDTEQYSLKEDLENRIQSNQSQYAYSSIFEER